jgi:hypothetical protein
MILNLTQHKATPKQVKAGVVDLADADRSMFCALLTFEALPTPAEIEARAAAIALITSYIIKHGFDGEQPDQVLIDGHSWLIAALERNLKRGGMKPVYLQKKHKKQARFIPAA